MCAALHDERQNRMTMLGTSWWRRPARSPAADQPLRQVAAGDGAHAGQLQGDIEAAKRTRCARAV